MALKRKQILFLTEKLITIDVIWVFNFKKYLYVGRKKQDIETSNKNMILDEFQIYNDETEMLLDVYRVQNLGNKHGSLFQ